MNGSVMRAQEGTARLLGPAVGIALLICYRPVAAGPIDEWQQARKLDTCEAYQAYAAKYPDNQLSQMAKTNAAKRCTPVIVPLPEPPIPKPPEPTPEPPTPIPSTPPPVPSDGRETVKAVVRSYYEALDRADADAAARMWFKEPEAIKYVPDNEYCKLKRNDVTDYDSRHAVVAVDVTCKNKRERARLYKVNMTLERDGSQWKIRSLKLR